MSEIETLRARVAELEKLVYVPGLWRCAKCACSTISTNLHVHSGGFSANNSPQTCPNNCGPMWRVTERDAGNRLIDQMDHLIDVRAVHLVKDGDYAVVRLEARGRWVELIREHVEGPFSHFCERGGIEQRLEQSIAGEAA